MWTQTTDSFAIKLDLIKCESDHCVYVYNGPVVLYVDDLIVASSNDGLLKSIKSALIDQFDVSHFGELNCSLDLST